MAVEFYTAAYNAKPSITGVQQPVQQNGATGANSGTSGQFWRERGYRSAASVAG